MLKLFYGHGKCNCSLCWHNWTNFDLINLYTNINEKWTVLRGGSKKLLWILNSYFTIEVWWSPCYQCYCFLFAKWALLHGYTMTCILRGHTNICCVYILEKDLNAYRKPEIYRNHKKSWIFFFLIYLKWTWQQQLISPFEPQMLWKRNCLFQISSYSPFPS